MNAKTLILIGIVIISLGIILYFFPNAFKWFGNLPGDFKSKGENASFYFPLTSMIIVSILFNIVLRMFRYLS